MTLAGFPTSTARVIRYRRDQLRRLIAPRSVAIIGASDRKSRSAIARWKIRRIIMAPFIG